MATFEPGLALPSDASGRDGWARLLGGAGARRWAGVVGALELGIAIGLIVAGTMLLDRGPMGARVALVVAGIALAWVGLRTTARAVLDRDVDLVFGLSVVWVTVIVGAAVLAPVLPLGQYADTAKTLNVPGYLRPDLFSAHPLGTNQFGLDELARVIWGARDSLLTSTLAVVVGTVVGGVIGVVAGYFSGWADRVIGVGTNVGLAFPPLVLLLTLAAILRQSELGLAMALGVVIIPGTVRVARANALTIAQREFTLAARVLGATRRQVLVRELLPNVALPLASLAFVTIPLIIIAEASLSFLGLGVPPPAPSWGGMVAEGLNGVFEANPFIVLVPGTAIFLTVLSLNVIGKHARKRWDPRQSKL